VPPKPTPERVNRFSDGVFAVLITVLIFNLRPPELPTFGAMLLLWAHMAKIRLDLRAPSIEFRLIRYR
jgi:uncharacterized membrane protein